MPKPSTRGKKKSHKGGHRHYTNEDDLALQAEKARKDKEWRSMKGIGSDEEGSDEDENNDKTASASNPDKLPSELKSDEETTSSDEDEEEDKPKGISHLIEIENPNRIKQKSKKVTELTTASGESAPLPTLSRREKEEIEKIQSKERYQKCHEAGKTDEARADLARLALIRKQREDAVKKREEEKKKIEAELGEKLQEKKEKKLL